MLILIDGLDLTGKSTLAYELSRRCSPPAPVLHHSGKPTTGDPYIEYCASIDWYGDTRDLIVDRCYISELVWPKIFGRDTTFQPGDLEDCVRFFADRKARYVHCGRNIEQLRQELVDRGEPLDPDDAARAEGYYWAAYTDLRLNPIFYDYSWDDQRKEETIQMILSPGFVPGREEAIL